MLGGRGMRAHDVEPRRLWLLVAGVSWIAALAAGFSIIWNYELTAAPAGVAPTEWPEEAGVPFQIGRPNLVLVAHPRCPCTRASLGELARLVAWADGNLAVHVLFTRPEGAPDGWTDTDLWASAALIPGADVRVDEGGRAAEHFGALTSGQVFVYDRAKRLQFAGGITAARGHAGDNAGSAAVLDVIEHGTTDRAQTPVFGCGLREAPRV